MISKKKKRKPAWGMDQDFIIWYMEVWWVDN